MKKSKRVRSRVRSFVPQTLVPESRPLSDKSALVWKGVQDALGNAANAFNLAARACQEAVLVRLAEIDDKDVSPEGGWKFDLATARWVRHVGL